MTNAVSFDPNNIDIEKRYGHELVLNKDTIYKVHFTDGDVLLEGKWLLINIVIWKPLIYFKMPISQDYLLHKTIVTNKGIAKVQDKIFRAVMAVNPKAKEKLAYFFTKSVNDLYNITSTMLGRHHKSISIFDLSKIVANPEIAQYLPVDISKENELGMNAVEKKIKDVSDIVLKKLEDKNLPGNTLYPFVKLGIISTQQLAQVMVSIGTRTDANDMMIRRAVVPSVLEGMKSIEDYATESLSAKKAIFYNRFAMKDSQYANRQFQLQASVIRRVVPHYCNSNLPIDFHIHEDNYPFLDGKYIVEDGNFKELTQQNLPQYVDKHVKMMTSMCCHTSDGVCPICGGTLINYTLEDVKMGLTSVSILMGEASQLILKQKHLSKTNAIAYHLPTVLDDIFVVRKNDIFIKDPSKLDKLAIVIPFSHAFKIDDLQYVENEVSISEQHFSSISTLSLVDSVTGEVYCDNINMLEKSEYSPFFSSDILKHIKLNFDKISVGDTIFIPLAKFNPTKPLLRCTIENDSMLKYKETVVNFLKKDIAHYKSVSLALKDFTDIIYKKTSPHITHAEIVLKSCMITNSMNYAPPAMITDPDNVTFKTLYNLISRRNIATQLGFERLHGYLANPKTFIFPSSDGIFDTFLGYID